MKYLIVGAGAIGSILAAYLTRAGRDVTLVARGENLKVIQERGLLVKSVDEDDFVVRVKAVAEQEYDEKPDVIIPCVKAYSLDEIYPFLDRVSTTDTIVLPILNALNIGDRISRGMSTSVTIVEAVAYVAVLLTAPGEVRKKLDFFRVVLGMPHGEPPISQLEALRADLEAAGATAMISPNMLQSELQKFVRVSALSAAEIYFDADAGGVRSESDSMTFLLDLGRELVQIADAAGIPLPGDPVGDMENDVRQVNADYVTSLVHDVRLGHQTEFQTQLFDVFDLGRSLGLEMSAYGRVSAKLGYAPAIAALGEVVQ